MPLPLRRALPLLLALSCGTDTNIPRLNTPPSAEILDPAPGDRVLVGDPLTLRGSVSDETDRAGLLAVSWLADGRALCGPTAPDPDGLTTCETSLGPGEATITLHVVDPLSLSDEATVTLDLITPKAPTLTRLRPLPDELLMATVPFDLAIQLADDEDTPADLALAWTSSDPDLPLTELPTTPDSNGILATTLTRPEPGELVLTLTATDLTDRSTTLTLTLDVAAFNDAPGCVFLAPDPVSVHPDADPVTIIALATDEQSDPADLLASITSDRDGPLLTDATPDADGTLTLSADLSAGAHTLTLTAADPGGLTCTTTLDLLVGDPPTLTLLTPHPGTRLNVGAPVEFAAIATDAATPAPDLTVLWTSDLDGTLDTTPPDAAGLLGFTADWLLPGDHDITLTVTNMDGLTATISTTLLVNTPPVVPALSLSPADPTTLSDLSAAPAGPPTDPDGDPLTLTWSWTRDGTPQPTHTTATLPASATARGQTWAATLTASDGLATTSASASTLILNSPPQLTAADLTPADPTTLADLTCVAGEASDSDGDPVTFTYAWTRDANPIAGQTSATLPAAQTTRGQTFACTITPNDGLNHGTPVTSPQRIIRNSAPTLTAPTLAPDPAATLADLTCTPGTAADSDGDPVTVLYRWTRDDSSLPGQTSATLSASHTARDQAFVCHTRPTDGDLEGTETSSAALTIANTPPTLASLNILPADATATTPLTCTPGPADDVDGDAISFTYTWARNGGALPDTTATLDPPFQRGHVVSCTATPTDGTTPGAPRSASTTIGNSPPTLPTATLTPADPTTLDTLTCTPSGATDPDGDNISYTYTWTRNGSPLPGQSAATLPASQTARGQTFTCTITPNDGFNHGTPATSATVTVGNSPPTLPTATLTPTDPSPDDTLTCTPSGATDPDGDNISYTYAWTRDGTPVAGQNVSILPSSQTSDGQDITCTITPNDGFTDGAPATSAPVTITASTGPFPFGNHVQLSSAAILGANALLAFPITLPSHTTVAGIGAIWGMNSGNLAVALYSDAADAPSALLAQAGATSVVAGRQSYLFTGGDISVPAGTYWMAVQLTANTSIVAEPSSVPANVPVQFLSPFAFTVPFPDPHPPATPFLLRETNLYLLTR